LYYKEGSREMTMKEKRTGDGLPPETQVVMVNMGERPL